MIIRLIKGNCIDILPKLGVCVDLVVTDPPYNISKSNNFCTMGRNGIDFGEWDHDADILSYIDHIPKICNKDASVIIFNDWKNLGNIARYAEHNKLCIKDLIRWEKSNPMPRNTTRRYVSDSEYFVWLTMPKSKWVFNKNSSTYDRPVYKGSLTPKSEKVGHSTQKPVYLMEAIILQHSNEGDTIIDMFMGSGTTAIACINTNRNFIGIELEEEYFDMANKRIRTHAECYGYKGIVINDS